MEMKDRIKQIMEREQLSPKSFAEYIGVQQSTLSHIMNGRNKPSLEVVMRIHQAYRNINLEWLLYGIGQMEVHALDKKGEEGMSSGLSGVSKEAYVPSLFDENPFNRFEREKQPQTVVKMPHVPSQEVVKQEIRYIEVPTKKITEIRIFFDDNTYEIFQAQK